MKTCLKIMWSMTLLMSTLYFMVGCDSDEDKCSVDTDCVRGAVCQSGLCAQVECLGIESCPGTGRTCLPDLRTCSPKECGDADAICADGKICLEAGLFRFACVDCETDAQCLLQEESCVNNFCVDCSADPTTCGGASDDMFIAVLDTGTGIEDAGVMMPDVSIPEVATLCSNCTRDIDCDDLGEGAQCTPIGSSGSFCTSACAGPGDCPGGFICLEQIAQCVPENFSCDVCPGRPCPEGSVCDVSSGACGEPRGACQPCSGDNSCAAGFGCGAYQGQDVCLQTCANGGGCAAGFGCENDRCVPSNGVCDPCGGQCGADQICLTGSGECGECDGQNPCPAGETCDLRNNTCAEGAPCECVLDEDCASCGGQPICLGGSCVACLEDADCPAQYACTEDFTCVSAPCAGFDCQQGSRCDPQLGRCVGDDGQVACQTANDCSSPELMGCNNQTGQCYYLDGTCDPAGMGNGVCMPGSTCEAHPLFMVLYCSCRKTNPEDFFSLETLIGCHPGFTCIQLSADADGGCNGGM